jgi:glucose-6-phosphate isomerase
MMFDGEIINNTENSAVLHTHMRKPDRDHRNLANVSAKIRNKEWTGHTGKPLDNIINIGIGGSSLGTRMVCDALKSNAAPDVTMRFVSNIDSEELLDALKDSSPETTLFVIASKTFTTQETFDNALSAKKWIIENLGSEEAISKHFIALSSNIEEAERFGIAKKNILPMDKGVGGRYSIWSSIGLPICIALGFEEFKNLLNGAYSMDKHFQSAPLKENLPLILALLGIWNRNFLQTECHAICPYSYNLKLFPSWIQQVDMESNGKSIDRYGNKIDYATGPVIFGETGTNCQHSFFQLLHQSKTVIPCDFIAYAKSSSGNERQHNMLLSNMLAQSEALMKGKKEDESKNYHKTCDGNRPSNIIMIEELNAYNLGMLLSLYEHKIFTQGIIWNINSFDQWGVELGKSIANDILSGTCDSKLPIYLKYLNML